MVYATIGARDLAEALVFYDAVMATIGWRRHADFPTSSAYSLDGSGEGFTLWVCRPFDGGTASAGNGAMIGFPAPSQEAVEAFYTTALRLGGRDEGAPGLRLHYGPQVYVAYVRDLSGNKLSMVHSGG